MTENDIRLNKIIGKLTDDYYAFGKFDQKILKEDWIEIKPALKYIADKAFGSIHENILPHLNFQKVIDQYESSGLII
jgi:hypothetical protein